jgi:hypothetical protein
MPNFVLIVARTILRRKIIIGVVLFIDLNMGIICGGVVEKEI